MRRHRARLAALGVVLCGHCARGFAAEPGSGEPQPLDTIPVDPATENEIATPDEPARPATRTEEIIVTARRAKRTFSTSPSRSRLSAGKR